MSRSVPCRGPLAVALYLCAALAGCAAPPGGTPAALGPGARDAAQLELGNRLANGVGLGKDPEAGAAVVRQAADRGNAFGEMLLGDYYFAGTGVERNPQMAATWIQRAADHNLVPAKAELAALYIRGIGVTQDYEKARQLAQSAASQGNAAAMSALGLIYLNGYGVPKDAKTAIDWYRKAAANGNAVAMIELGSLYRDGKQLPADRPVAYAWFNLAFAVSANLSDRLSASRLRDDLALLMSPEEVAEGNRLSANWKPGRDLETGTSVAAAGDKGQKGDGKDIVTNSVPLEGPAALRKPADIGAVELNGREEIEVAPDGTKTVTDHSEIEIKNESAISQMGQRPYLFNASLDTLEVVEAYNRKPDGRKIEVDRAAIFEQLVPGSPTAPMYSDQKQKVIVFPDVEVGDVLVTTVKMVDRPYLQGMFSLTHTFERTFAVKEVRVHLVVPKAMPVLTETHDLRFAKHEEGDKTIYDWTYANPRPLAEDDLVLDATDRAPRLFASNFAGYEAFAHAYAAVADAMTTVTPAIQKQADEITRGVTDRRQQAEKIYYWVSRRIRYVGIELGRGSIVPHAAASVLANGYGDCKDHSALLVALLKAKGIPADIVLINYGNGYSLPAPPTLGVFNHAITYLPEFDLFVDSTAGVAPFGMLPFGEHGKSVVLAVASGPAVRHTPLLKVEESTVSTRTRLRLTGDGKLLGESAWEASGPFAVWMRQVASNMQNAGPETAMKQLLKEKGFNGSGRFEFGSPFEPGSNYRIGAHFEITGHSDWVAGNSFFLPVGASLGTRPGEMLIGPIDRMDVRNGEPTPCYAGRETEEIALELPPGKHLKELPKGTEFSNDLARYKSEWTVSGQTVTVRRELTSLAAAPVCAGPARLIAVKAMADIRADYNKAIALVGN